MLLEAHIIINMHDICARGCGFTTKLPPQDEKKTHVRAKITYYLGQQDFSRRAKDIDHK